MSRQRRITKEIKRLEEIFKGIEKDKKSVVKASIENLAFMTVCLEDLTEIIKVKGFTESYTNGQHQQGVKESSEVKTYNNIIKNHLSITKQLLDLLPEGNSEADELMNFLKNSGVKK